MAEKKEKTIPTESLKPLTIENQLAFYTFKLMGLVWFEQLLLQNGDEMMLYVNPKYGPKKSVHDFTTEQVLSVLRCKWRIRCWRRILRLDVNWRWQARAAAARRMTITTKRTSTDRLR